MEARDDSYQALRHRIVLISRMDRLEEIYRVGFSDHVRLVVRPGQLASGIGARGMGTITSLISASKFSAPLPSP
jgi:hypothetical protein